MNLFAKAATLVIVTVLLDCWSHSAQAAYCGPQTGNDSIKKKLLNDFFRALVPEYACFTVSGKNAVPWGLCADGPPVFVTLVHFGTACKQHDTCYSTKGQLKEKCDDDFKKLLELTCDQTLTGWHHYLSRKACRDFASTYYKAVRTPLGDKIFNNAQNMAFDREIQQRRNKAMTFKTGKSGNPAGRPKRARNRTTRAIETLLDREAEELTRTVISKAKAGDMTALKLCLDRLAPIRKGRPIVIDLPKVSNATDLAKAGAQVTQHLADGVISPEEAQAVMATLDSALRLFEAGDLEERIAALEERLAS